MAKTLISLRVEEALVERVKQLLGAKSRTQAMVMALEAVLELEKHRHLIRRFSSTGRSDDFVHS